MEYKRLGRTGLMVSKVSLGTVEIGLNYGIGQNGTANRPEESEAAHLLHRALDLGVNFIDTARAYGESEAIIGRALKGRRHEFVLCSKVLAYENEAGDNLRAKVTESVQESLRALNTDVLDILMIHSAPTEVLSRTDLIEILEDLRREGKFRWMGVSVYGEAAALAAVQSGRFDCVQVAYSVLDRRPEGEVWKEAVRNDIGIVARSVLLKGLLTPRYQFFPSHLSVLKTVAGRLERLGESTGISLPELAYRYVLTGPLPHTALVGASSLQEMEAAVRFAEAGALPNDLMDRVREIELDDPKYLNPATWGIG
jgi:1-deoxyxylulose-5-phosphate synthase